MNNLLYVTIWKIELVWGSPHPPHSANCDPRHARAVKPALLPLIRRTTRGNEACLFGDPRSWLGVESGAPLYRVQPGNALPPSRGQQRFPQRGFQNRWVDSREPASLSPKVDRLQTVHERDRLRMSPGSSATTVETCRDQPRLWS